MMTKKLGYGLLALCLMSGVATPVSATSMPKRHKSDEATHKKIKKVFKEIQKNSKVLSKFKDNVQKFNELSKSYKEKTGVDEGSFPSEVVNNLEKAVNAIKTSGPRVIK